MSVGLLHSPRSNSTPKHLSFEVDKSVNKRKNIHLFGNVLLAHVTGNRILIAFFTFRMDARPIRLAITADDEEQDAKRYIFSAILPSGKY